MGQWFQGSLLWAHKSPGHFRAGNSLFCSCSAPWKIAFVSWRDTGISAQQRHTYRRHPALAFIGCTWAPSQIPPCIWDKSSPWKQERGKRPDQSHLGNEPCQSQGGMWSHRPPSAPAASAIPQMALACMAMAPVPGKAVIHRDMDSQT